LLIIGTVRQTIPGLLILGGAQGKDKADESKDSSSSSQTKVNSLFIVSTIDFSLILQRKTSVSLSSCPSLEGEEIQVTEMFVWDH